MYTVNQIADFFLSRISLEKGDTMSPLKLQKLVYYAQAWHLTTFNSPLFDEEIQAWKNGPVIPSLYRRFATTPKYSAIDLSMHEVDAPNIEGESGALLEEIILVYGERSASFLEELTHQETPWIKARGKKKPHEYCTSVITHKSMIEYYSQFKNEA